MRNPLLLLRIVFCNIEFDTTKDNQMTLLEDIQQAAIDANSDLATLLRKCKLLAARLGSQPLEDWVLWESNGYPDNVPVPRYRVWPLTVKGYFVGPVDAYNNLPIPYPNIPVEARKHYEHYECRQSIAAIETVLANLAKNGSSTPVVSTGDLAMVLGKTVYQGYSCLQAWAECTPGNFVEVVNSVRNRILDFSLAVWKEAPNAGEAEETNSKIETMKVTQIFNTTIYGGSANLVGTANHSPVTLSIVATDFTALREALRQYGVQDPDVDELEKALNEEPKPNSNKSFGPKVATWVAKMVQKAAEGTWNIGLETAGGLLAQIIGKFYGL